MWVGSEPVMPGFLCLWFRQYCGGLFPHATFRSTHVVEFNAGPRNLRRKSDGVVEKSKTLIPPDLSDP